jgi:hypothetical protein
LFRFFFFSNLSPFLIFTFQLNQLAWLL